MLEFRQNAEGVLRRVARGERFVLSRRGKPAAILFTDRAGCGTMARAGWHHRWNPRLIAASGHVVAQVNRQGSTGFGERFARSLLGARGDKPFEDILTATDHLLAKLPNLDARRLAATGASYGGYLAAAILGQTDRFARMVNHAGVCSPSSQFGSDVP